MSRKPNPKKTLITQIKTVYKEHGRRRQAKMDAYNLEELQAHLKNITSPEWDWKIMGFKDNRHLTLRDETRTDHVMEIHNFPSPDLQQWNIGPGDYVFTVPPGFRAELVIRKTEG